MAETLNWSLSGSAALIALVVGYLFGSIPFDEGAWWAMRRWT